MPVAQSEQLMLPIPVRPEQTVAWYNVRQQTKRRMLFGTKVTTELLHDDAGRASRTELSVDQINELEDPALRCTLRLAATASSIGNIATGEYSSTSHHVSADATDEGLKSRLVSDCLSAASYAALLVDIHRFGPDPDENH